MTKKKCRDKSFYSKDHEESTKLACCVPATQKVITLRLLVCSLLSRSSKPVCLVRVAAIAACVLRLGPSKPITGPLRTNSHLLGLHPAGASLYVTAQKTSI